MKPATRSPAPTPARAQEAGERARRRRAARRRSVVAWRRARSRPRALRASSRRRSRFSAKLSRAPTNQRGPSSGSGGAMRSPCSSTASHGGAPARSSATTPAKRQSAGQNRSGSAIDHVVEPNAIRDARGAAAERLHRVAQEPSHVRRGDRGLGWNPERRRFRHEWNVTARDPRPLLRAHHDEPQQRVRRPRAGAEGSSASLPAPRVRRK